jgi:predicted nuclease of restriction endonuclease-like (RecB) superfamily
MNFGQLTQHIKQTHDALQSYAVKAINIGLTLRNWLIGHFIVEYEQHGEDRANYGEHLLEKISAALVQNGLKNVSVAELSRFRQFYTVYPQILGTLSQELQVAKNKSSVEPIRLISNLSFSHFAELIKITDPLKRSFYEIECINGTWGVRELRRQINSLFFERTGLSRKPEKLIELVQTNAEKINVSEIIKSPFTFEFLGMKAKDVVVESDLVFYHRILHCHVLVEIKVDKFRHEYIGQLNAYIEHYKRHEMREGDSLPVGILLVTGKNNTLVEYATGTLDNQLFVSRYLLELPRKEDLERIIEMEIIKN